MMKVIFFTILILGAVVTHFFINEVEEQPLQAVASGKSGDLLLVSQKILSAQRLFIQDYKKEFGNYPALNGPQDLLYKGDPNSKALESLKQLENFDARLEIPNLYEVSIFHMPWPHGSNSICVVKSESDYYKDHALSHESCVNESNQQWSLAKGGYVYYPAKGWLRINAPIKGNDFRVGPQYTLKELGWSLAPENHFKFAHQTEPVRW